MRKPVLMAVLLLSFAAVYAQDDMSTMTGGDMMMGEMTGGDMMMGEMTGGDMMMGEMTGGGMMMEDMTGGAMMRQSTEVTLSGDQEVPAVMTDATGSATVTLSGMTLSLQGEFSGMSSPVVEIAGSPGHVHMAPMGENGGVVFVLNASVAEDGMSGIFSLETELSDEELEAFMAGELYLNFHTEMHEGGELRGQIVPSMGM